MGVELYITRAVFWADNEGAQISQEEWQAYVASDAELCLQPGNGANFVKWVGPSLYEDPWLDWASGNVSTKWPDTALYRKMLRVAKALRARIQDDNGTSYSEDDDWAFDPTSKK